jgi:hypothetical protein
MTCWLRTTSRVRTYGDAVIVTHLSTGEKAVNRFPSALWACHPGIKPDHPCASPIAFVSASRRSASSLSKGNATSKSMRRVISWVTFQKASLTVS